MNSNSFRTFFWLGIMGFTLIPWTGCLKAPPTPTPDTIPQKPVAPPPEFPKNGLQSHLEGEWENNETAHKPKTLIFKADGRLIFRGGLEFYNPARWELETTQQELRITLPNADVDRIRVFQLYVGDGLKAFDPIKKQITYHFDEQTWSLNMGGWIYSKPDTTIIKVAPQPPLD